MISLLIGFISFASAHGPVAEQASVAVKRVTEQFLKAEALGVQASFRSISAELIGEETFLVRVTLKGGIARTLEYKCGLDTAASPVKWGCNKLKN